MSTVPRERDVARNERRGKVYIVGAGPGDPKLITLRGLECIESADVLIYDRLVHPSLLERAPQQAEKIYAGKKPGDHMLPQERIHELLAMHADLGKNVVRLKGGDPLVFGRGGEEALFLAARAIPFEIVAGVSSAIAVPGAAGIAVTHRGVSHSFTVVTGHSCGQASRRDYAAMLRASGTLVILMGVRTLPDTVRQLLDGGLEPDTPVAVIQNGTLPEQKTLVTSLQDLLEDRPRIDAPAVIVIGEVVRLREPMRMLEERIAGEPSLALSG